jgi:carboxyl-terminal processing protease
MKKQGMEALILDERYNPGGLLSAAVDVSSQFIGDNKMIVYTQGRRPENRQEFRAGAKAPYGDIPMVCLVNGASASGSEIVAGALQDHQRAVLIGSRTFGKASVQSVIPLADGSGLRLTVAHYYTPAGRSIQRDHSGKKKKPGEKDEGGIVPDIVVDLPREAEAKLAAQMEEVFEPGKEPESAVKKDDRLEDVILKRGIELLKARGVLSRLSHEKGT